MAKKLGGYELRYCAFCRHQSPVLNQRHLGFGLTVSLLVSSLAFNLIFWRTVDARFLLVWSLFCGLAEVFCQVRWRNSLVCSNCGFDPLLYIKDQARAAAKVKNFVASKLGDPFDSLKGHPLRQLMEKKKDLTPPATSSQLDITL